MEEKKQYGTVIVKKVIVYALCFLTLWGGGIVVMKFFDWSMKLGMDNVVYEGFKVGFIAWVVVAILPLFTKKKK